MQGFLVILSMLIVLAPFRLLVPCVEWVVHKLSLVDVACTEEDTGNTKGAV